MLDRSIKIKKIAIDLFLTYLREDKYTHITFVYRISACDILYYMTSNELILYIPEKCFIFLSSFHRYT